MRVLLLAVVVAAAVPQTVLAAHPYVAAQFTRSRSSCQGFIDGVAPLGLTATCDDTDSGYRVAAGANLTRSLGLEVGYADGGEGKADAFSGNTYVLTLTAPFSAWDAVVTARGGLGKDLRVIVRGGVARWDYEVKSSNGAFGASNDGVTPTFGGGLELKWLTLGYDAVLKVGQGNTLAPAQPDIKQTIHRLSIGLKYTF